MSHNEQLAKAASLLSELFVSTALMNGLERDPPRKTLYIWETETLDWLREWRKVDKTSPINLWTSNYLQFGPPPWEKKS